jgi:hypothetical protein
MSFKVLDNLGQTSREIVESVGPAGTPQCGHLLDVSLELQRRIRHADAEADVDETGAFGEIDPEHHMRLRPEQTVGRDMRRARPAKLVT